MKYLIIFSLLILSFSSFSYDEELEGYTFQKNYEAKDSERTVANRRANSSEGKNFKKSQSKQTTEYTEDGRVKPEYWEWTEKVE